MTDYDYDSSTRDVYYSLTAKWICQQNPGCWPVYQGIHFY